MDISHRLGNNLWTPLRRICNPFFETRRYLSRIFTNSSQASFDGTKPRLNIFLDPLRSIYSRRAHRISKSATFPYRYQIYYRYCALSDHYPEFYLRLTQSSTLSSRYRREIIVHFILVDFPLDSRPLERFHSRSCSQSSSRADKVASVARLLAEFDRDGEL